MKKKTIILLAVILLVIVIGGILIFNIIKKNNWNNQELLYYSTSCGGDMNGGSDITQLSAFDGKALLTFSTREWYYQAPSVVEYLVDKEALNEIHAIFIKYGMYNWDNKNFSNIFVADGATTSYYFSFSDDKVNFSSQVYPASYAEKLAELDKIIAKYQADGEHLPGLVVPELSEEEQQSRQYPDDEEIAIDVYEYSQNRLYFYFLNGTADEIAVSESYILTDSSDNIVASGDNEFYTETIYPNESSEESISLNKRLEMGEYTLTIGEFSGCFEIK